MSDFLHIDFVHQGQPFTFGRWGPGELRTLSEHSGTLGLRGMTRTNRARLDGQYDAAEKKLFEEMKDINDDSSRGSHLEAPRRFYQVLRVCPITSPCKIIILRKAYSPSSSTVTGNIFEFYC